jgi:hypothetical protein
MPTVQNHGRQMKYCGLHFHFNTLSRSVFCLLHRGPVKIRAGGQFSCFVGECSISPSMRHRILPEGGHSITKHAHLHWDYFYCRYKHIIRIDTDLYRKCKYALISWYQNKKNESEIASFHIWWHYEYLLHINYHQPCFLQSVWGAKVWTSK